MLFIMYFFYFVGGFTLSFTSETVEIINMIFLSVSIWSVFFGPFLMHCVYNYSNIYWLAYILIKYCDCNDSQTGNFLTDITCNQCTAKLNSSQANCPSICKHIAMFSLLPFWLFCLLLEHILWMIAIPMWAVCMSHHRKCFLYTKGQCSSSVLL